MSRQSQREVALQADNSGQFYAFRRLRVYWVTDGPMFISPISTSMPKFCRVLFMMLALALMSPLEGLLGRFQANLTGGTKSDRLFLSLFLCPKFLPRRRHFYLCFFAGGRFLILSPFFLRFFWGFFVVNGTHFIDEHLFVLIPFIFSP